MKKIYQSFWQISLMFGLTLVTSNAQALECTPTPDCGSLGYTKTEADCQGADVVLKCPYNTKQVACLLSNVSSTPLEILYGDGTVSNKVIVGKTPIGVVFDAENRLALALTNVKQDGSAGSEEMQWSSNTCDIPNLEECWDETTVLTSCGVDGRANTDAILASTECGTTYAADAVNAYNPGNCGADFCKQGKWFLPSLRDLNTISSKKTEINNSLTLLASQGASTLGENDHYWSSTVYSNPYAWRLHMLMGNKSSDYKYVIHYVRPGLAF